MTPESEQTDATDTELLRGIAGGDRTAFTALYDRHASILFGVVLRIMRVRSEAEDVLQETFIQIWQRAGDFDETRGRPLSWLTLLTRSRALDRVRSRSFRDRASSTDVERAEDPATGDVADDVMRMSEGTSVRRALAEIPAVQREALLLAYFEGLSQSEIAMRLGKPLGTVKTHTRLGLLRLREVLGVAWATPEEQTR